MTSTVGKILGEANVGRWKVTVPKIGTYNEAIRWVTRFWNEQNNERVQASPEQEEIEAALLQQSTVHFVVIGDDGNIVGVLALSNDGDVANVEHLGSLEHGAGSSLIARALKYAKIHGLDLVLSSSNSARGFYERLGFEHAESNIYLTTTLPRTIDPDLLDKLTCVNVSLQSVDNGENKRLLNVEDDVDRIRNLRDLLYLNPGNVRVNLILRKGGIDTSRKLENALGYLYVLGVRDVKLVELQHHDELYVSYAELTGKDLGPAYAYGCERKLDNFVDMKVSIKLACALVSDVAVTGYPDLLKHWWKRVTGSWNRDFMVIHPDASCRDTW